MTTPLVLSGVTFTGGVQILNYDTAPPAPSNYYILDETNNVITTEDDQYGFVTE
jgi:hypothetical protein